MKQLTRILVDLAFLQVAIMDMHNADGSNERSRYFKLRDTWQQLKFEIDKYLEFKEDGLQ
jgi:hypothetical protein